MEKIKKKKRVKKTMTTIIIVFLVLIAAAGAFAGNFLYNFALKRKASVADPIMDAASQGAPDGFGDTFKKDEAWAESVKTASITITSEDGLMLHAYFIEAPSTDKYVILCHGYQSNADSMFGFAKIFYEMGYGCLIPDARGHGQSEGDYIGMGWPERNDIAAWSELIAAKSPDCKIVLFGISMGGATVMMAAGEELPSNVSAVVEDCGYSSIKDEMSYQLKKMFKLPSFPFLNLASIFSQIRAGYSIVRDGDAAAQVAECEIPILFIHGGNDKFVPTEMVYTLYEAADCEKELLIIEGAGHGMASAQDPDGYWNAVKKFLAEYVDGK